MVTDRTEQEAQELEQLKANSPYELPDDAAKSGWTAAQIKEKFYAGLFFLYKLFKSLRQGNDTFTHDIDERISQLETDIEAILSQVVAIKDIEGNDIVSTYARIGRLQDGTTAVLKYITATGTTADIRDIASRLETFITSINAQFNGDKAKKAEVADKATLDGSGRNIVDTYATQLALQNLTTTVNALVNGNTAAYRAYRDGNGMQIDTTYVKKAQIVDALNDTSTDKPLSANQGKVLKDLISAIQLLLASNDTDLDTIQEIVTYVKNNKSLIENITTSKVSVSDIVDNLTSQISNKPASAKQVYILKGFIDDINSSITLLGDRVTALETTQSQHEDVANALSIVDGAINITYEEE